jgi:hypothetical protein
MRIVGKWLSWREKSLLGLERGGKRAVRGRRQRRKLFGRRGRREGALAHGAENVRGVVGKRRRKKRKRKKKGAWYVCCSRC